MKAKTKASKPSKASKPRLPSPLRGDDLCQCGKIRSEHQGKHGWGRCLECPSFQEAD